MSSASENIPSSAFAASVELSGVQPGALFGVEARGELVDVHSHPSTGSICPRYSGGALMRLIVFSDTHGRCSMLPQCVRRTGPDMIVHLGDHMRDTRIIEESFPEIPLYAVPGNCDFSSAEDTLTFSAGGVLVFATHGHRYGVKSTMDSLLNSAPLRRGAARPLRPHAHRAHRLPRRHDRRKPRLLRPRQRAEASRR